MLPTVAGLLAICLLTGSSVLQAKMFRWVDDKGNIFYSDQVPPEQVKFRRESLNKKVRVVEVREAEKTQEQKELEQRLKELRAEKEKVIAEREAQDQVLLSTFRSVEDMRLALQGKLQSIQARKRVSEGNLKRLEYQLEAQQKKAAAYERKGQQVPEKLFSEIKGTEEQMRLVYIDINRHLRKIQQTEEAFGNDIDRFVFLTKKKTKEEQTKVKKEGTITASMLGLFTCKNDIHCASAWEIARLYVKNHSSTDIELDSKKLIMTTDPLMDSDVSLSVTRIKDEHGRFLIFLDIHCRESEKGRELCASRKVNDIRAEFTPFIESILAAD